MRHRWSWTCTDLTVYAEQSLGKDAVMAMDPEEYREGIHELFAKVAGETRLVADYADVLEEEASWRLVTRGLLRLRAGERFAMQPVTAGKDTGAGVGTLEEGPVPAGRWWLRPRGVACWASAVAIASGSYSHQVADSGRVES